MFFTQDDDDQDFVANTGGKSKLASLFGTPTSQDANESLTYTAPKEPKKKEEQPAKAGPALLQVAAVHAYKYVDGQYASQGKVGAAVLGNDATDEYSLLLYVSKQQRVTSAKITPSFALTLQPNRYAIFYDDARLTWSLLFDTDANREKFSKELALAKANSGGPSLNTLISQDLQLGEGGPLENSDSAEVRYTGWLLKDKKFGSQFDSNATAEKLFRFKVGKGKVIKGWDEGILGMKKNGKRLLIVPPALAYGSKGMGDRVPPNATLVFELEVVRVKLAKEYVEPPKSEIPIPQQEAANEKEADTEDDGDGSSVKARTRSISEQMEKTSGKSDKAKLISRMAKMGQQMLPVSGSAADDSEDSESQVAASPDPTKASANDYATQQPIQNAYQQQQQQPPIQAFPQHMNQPMMAQPGVQTLPPQSMAPPASVMQGVPAGSQLAMYQSPQQFMQQAGFQPNYGFPQQPQPPQYQNMYPQQQSQIFGGAPSVSTSSASDIHTPVLLSETRQQNTEVRLAIGKLSDKLDRVTEKLDHMQVHGNSSLAVSGSSPNMETGVLLHNISRIVQDNERLKKELFEKSARIEAQNEKIADLLQRNQKYVEQSNMMIEQRNDQFKNNAAQATAKVLTLEQEKVQFATELSAATSQLSTLQMEIGNLKKKETELRQQLDAALTNNQQNKEEMSNLKALKAENETKLEHLNNALKEEKATRKLLEGKNTTLEEELGELKSSNDALELMVGEKKKKTTAERKKLENELEELKVSYENEVADLKEKLRKQRASTDVATAEQVAQVEAEISAEWKEKSDRLLASAQERHQRALQDVQEEKETLERKLKDIEEKLSNVKASKGETEEHVEKLTGELDEMKVWKTKYNNLRSQATSMKERYEERITELETEQEETVEENTKLIERARQLQLQLAAAPTATSGGNNQQQVAGEVKKVMNSVYHSLKGEFDAAESYEGSDVHTAILNTIKTVTLKMVQQQNSKTEDEEEEEEEEEESEHEEEIISHKQTETNTQEIKKEVTAMQQTAAKTVDEAVPSSGDSNNPQLVESIEAYGEGVQVEKITKNDAQGTDKIENISDSGDGASLTDTDSSLMAETNEKSQEISAYSVIKEETDESDIYTNASGPNDGMDKKDSSEIIPEENKTVSVCEAAADTNVENNTEELNSHKDVEPPRDDTKIVEPSEMDDDQESPTDEKENTTNSLEDSEESDIKDEDVESFKTPPIDIEKENEGEGEDLFTPTPTKPEESKHLESESLEENEEDKSDDLFVDSKTEQKEDLSFNAMQGRISLAATDEDSEKEEEKDTKGGKDQVDKTTNPLADDQTDDDIFGEPDPLFGGGVTIKKSTPAKKEEKDPKKTAVGKPPTNEGEKSLFGEDENVDDTFGFTSKPKQDGDTVEKNTKLKNDKKKQAEDSDEDIRPKPPPPPLFGSDDDDDDLDWLS